MRNSLLAATLIAFGAAVTVPAIAAEKKAAPSEQQMQKDAGKGVTEGSTDVKPAQSEASGHKPAPSETSGKDRPDQK
jgi:hypothetical protein